jgi:DNA-binding GntR family transcriptional regulator
MKRNPRKKRALANEIADAIQLGEFRSGEWLRQIDLEEKFKASRFDVRTALDELVVRKAVEHVPNRGHRVAVLDPKTIAAIREVRLIVECAAAPGIVTHADAAALSDLKALAGNFTMAVAEGTHADQSRTNREFHRFLYALCGNSVLEETIWALRERSRGSSLTIWPSHAAMEQADRDHHDMLGAIEARDAERLAGLIRTHITRNP